MQLTIKNQTSNPLSYVQGFITVDANSSTTVSREYNTILTSDAGFLSDASAGNIIVNNGYVDLTSSSIISLSQTLAAFSTNPIATIPLYYSIPVNIRQSAGTSANQVVWSMRNNPLSPKIIMVEKITLTMSFDSAAPMTRTSLVYDLVRFNSANLTSGTSISPIQMDSNGPSTFVTDARFLDTGLTTVGVVFESAFSSIGCPASDGATSSYNRNVPIKLGAGEGLAIRLNTDAIAGQGIFGEIIWSER